MAEVEMKQFLGQARDWRKEAHYRGMDARENALNKVGKIKILFENFAVARMADRGNEARRTSANIFMDLMRKMDNNFNLARMHARMSTACRQGRRSVCALETR